MLIGDTVIQKQVLEIRHKRGRGIEIREYRVTNPAMVYGRISCSKSATLSQRVERSFKATSMRTKATVIEEIRPNLVPRVSSEETLGTRLDKTLLLQEQKKNMKIKLKNQQAPAAVLSLLGLISMAQLADELWVPTQDQYHCGGKW